MSSIGLIAGLLSVIILSGCVSQDQPCLNDSETSGNEIVEGTYSNSENLMNSVETAELKENEVKHCICHLMEVQYDYSDYTRRVG